MYVILNIPHHIYFLHSFRYPISTTNIQLFDFAGVLAGILEKKCMSREVLLSKEFWL